MKKDFDFEVLTWISVEEELPEEHVPVIVAREYEPGKPMKVEQAYLQHSGWWKVYGTNVRRGVRFWMPLPKPPDWESLSDEIAHVGYDDAQMGREK